jgi:hypothetical protein
MAEQRGRKWVYLVLEKFWSYNDEYYTGADTPVLAFRSLEQAEEYVARCRAAAEPYAYDLTGMQADLEFEIVETEVEE